MVKKQMTIMEMTKPNLELQTTNVNFISSLTVEELINQAIESGSETILVHSRQELVSRGKDDIPTRIFIKKSCKASISSIESLLRKADSENSTSTITKSLKKKFLTSISILDRLQLEWQKHDLSIKY